MSRSYRKPYGTYCSIKRSAHADKQMAARGVRRRQNAWLRHWDEEADLIPHRYECRHNNMYSWIRDGRQFEFTLTGRDWNRYLEAVQGNGLWAGDKDYMVWPPVWYREIVRK